MDSFGADSESLDGPGPEEGAGEAEEFVNEEYEHLVRRWRNEAFAPEILPFDEDMVSNMTEANQYLSEALFAEAQEMEDGGLDPMDSTIRSIDLDRVKYWLRDYLRIRLWKLMQWPQHYLKFENQERLSEAERVFLREHWSAKQDFLAAHLLNYLPEQKQQLDEKTDMMDMVRTPRHIHHVSSSTRRLT